APARAAVDDRREPRRGAHRAGRHPARLRGGGPDDDRRRRDARPADQPDRSRGPMSRIATFATGPALLQDVFAAQRSLLDIQRQISSGKRLQKGSDGPAEVVTTMDHRARLARSQQLERNADQARQWIGAADLTSQTVVGRLTEARTLLVQARSGAID